MNSRYRPLFVALIILILPAALLTACRPAELTPTPESPPAEETAEDTRPTNTPQEATATSAPSPSPLPPTATPSPTPPPSPTPTATPVPTPAPDLLVAQPGTAWNFELVGHDALGSTGWHGGLALKGSCAYVGNCGRSSIQILDIADPANPSPIGEISLAAGSRPVELRTFADLDLLVVADLAGSQLLTFDVGDCADPWPLGELDLAGSPHEFFLWRDETRVLAYAATFDHAPPNLVVIDVTDPANLTEVARWTAAREGVAGIMHSLSLSADGRRGYLAMWHGGFVVVEIDLPTIAVARDEEGTFNPAAFPNTHSAVPIGDPRFVLLASEVFNCPFEGLAIADISDPSHPEIISEFKLPENRCQDLPGGDAVFTPHNPLVVGDMALVSWYAAGVQAVDLSDPYAPRRLGQFVPQGEDAAPRSYLGSYPVQMCSYPILRDGLFYVVDSQSGLYVLRYTGPRAEEIATIPLAEGNKTVLPPGLEQ